MADLAVSINAAGGADYTSFNSAEATEQATYTDLVTDTNTITFTGTGATDDTTATNISGWTTSAAYNITFEGDGATEWDASKYTLSVANTDALTITERYCVIQNVQLELSATNANYQKVVRVLDRYNEIIKCILKGANNATYRERLIDFTGQDNYMANCLLYNANTSPVHIASATIYDATSAGVTSIYYCTIIGAAYNLYSTGAGTTVLKNCILDGAGTGVGSAPEGASDYNITDQSSGLTGGNSQHSQSFSFEAAAGDYHLTAANDDGIDLSGDGVYPVSDDVDGDARPVTTPDCGYDEYIAAGGGVEQGMLYHYFQTMRA